MGTQEECNVQNRNVHKNVSKSLKNYNDIIYDSRSIFVYCRFYFFFKPSILEDKLKIIKGKCLKILSSRIITFCYITMQALFTCTLFTSFFSTILATIILARKTAKSILILLNKEIFFNQICIRSIFFLSKL